MHEADLGHGLDDLLVLDDEIQMKRLGENRMLRSEGDDGCLSHAIHQPFRQKKQVRQEPFHIRSQALLQL